MPFSPLQKASKKSEETASNAFVSTRPGEKFNASLEIFLIRDTCICSMLYSPSHAPLDNSITIWLRKLDRNFPFRKKAFFFPFQAANAFFLPILILQRRQSSTGFPSSRLYRISSSLFLFRLVRSHMEEGEAKCQSISRLSENHRRQFALKFSWRLWAERRRF